VSSMTKDEQEIGRAGLGTTLRTRVQLWIAVVFMAFAFGAGLTIGVIAHTTAPAIVDVAPASQAPAIGGAPPLSDQQLQQGLPSGHPALATPSGSG
jgi:hypothetical protein